MDLLCLSGDPETLGKLRGIMVALASFGILRHRRAYLLRTHLNQESENAERSATITACSAVHIRVISSSMEFAGTPGASLVLAMNGYS